MVEPSRRKRFRRKRSVVGLLALVASAIFLVPASQAFASTQKNACVNPVAFNEVAPIPVTTTATVFPSPVEEGESLTLEGIEQTLFVPPSVFEKGFQLGYLTLGENEVPVKLTMRVLGSNTVEGEQVAFVEGVAKTTISGTIENPEATPGIVEVTYPNETWTATGVGTIEFREKTVNPLSFPTGSTEAGLKIIAEAGAVVVPFDCSPGETAEEPEPPGEPSEIVYVEPATPFASVSVVPLATKYPLTVTAEGSGSGTFQCASPPLSTPHSCLSEYKEGSEVEVIPNPNSVSEFVSFGGECSGTSCTVTMEGPRSVTALFELKEAAEAVTGEVFGEVPQTTSIESGCSSVDLGEFLPGVETTYENFCQLSLTSTGEASSLTASDETGVDVGYLTQKLNEEPHNYTLASPLLVGAADLPGEQGGVPPAEGGPLIAPVNLLNWTNPISKDAVTVGFRQGIGEHEPLHTGKYAKTITLTLEQTTP